MKGGLSMSKQEEKQIQAISRYVKDVFGATQTGAA